MSQLHVNHEFVLDFIKKNASNGRVLDYGCGSGEIVREGLQRGFDIYGCEEFYAGSHGVEAAVADLLNTRVFKIENGKIPFPSSTFDCIVNNQVFEHVADLDLVLAEIARVLKPGAVLLSLFPSVETLREGHCGVALAHRFSRYSRLGYYWLLGGRLLGFGYNKNGKSPQQWANDFQHWLNRYCFYRRRKEIMKAYSAHGIPAKHAEAEYIRFRRLRLFTPWIFRKLGGMVLLSSKR